MQYSKVLAIIGFSAFVAAAPAAEAVAEAEPNAESLISIPILSGDQTTVSCSSGNVYCTDGSKTQCKKTNPGQKCTSGSVFCCNSAAGLINLNLLQLCGNPINISVPVTVSALNGI